MYSIAGAYTRLDCSPGLILGNGFTLTGRRTTFISQALLTLMSSSGRSMFKAISSFRLLTMSMQTLLWALKLQCLFALLKSPTPISPTIRIFIIPLVTPISRLPWLYNYIRTPAAYYYDPTISIMMTVLWRNQCIVSRNQCLLLLGLLHSFI